MQYADALANIVLENALISGLLFLIAVLSAIALLLGSRS